MAVLFFSPENKENEIHILEVSELGDILRWEMNDRQALSSEKRFLSLRRGSDPRPSDDRFNHIASKTQMVTQRNGKFE